MIREIRENLREGWNLFSLFFISTPFFLLFLFFVSPSLSLFFLLEQKDKREVKTQAAHLFLRVLYDGPSSRERKARDSLPPEVTLAGGSGLIKIFARRKPKILQGSSLTFLTPARLTLISHSPPSLSLSPSPSLLIFFIFFEVSTSFRQLNFDMLTQLLLEKYLPLLTCKYDLKLISGMSLLRSFLFIYIYLIF